MVGSREKKLEGEEERRKRKQKRDHSGRERENYLGFFFLSFSLPQEFCID